MLVQTLNAYLGVRRACGFELRVPEQLLRGFVHFAQQRGETHIRGQSAIEWAAQAPSPNQRDYRLKTLIRFARHVRAEDARHQVPPGGVFGRPRQRAVPFIFSRTEIGRLIHAASRLGPHGALRPHTYSTLFALLAATGLRISEALALRLDDVTVDGLLICNTKFKKSRLVPLHDSVTRGLERYLLHRQRLVGAGEHVFVSRYGQQLNYYTVYDTFRALIDAIGLRTDAGRRACLHSLRHTFAVRALEACPHGSDINRHMLALSTYLGHARVVDTYWYLEATAEVMTNIAHRCERFMKGGVQ